MKLTKTILSFLFTIGCFVLLSTSSMAASRQAPISPEKAFTFQAKAISGNEIQAQWKIAPGHFLYFKKIHIKAKSDIEVKLPAAEHKVLHDENFEIYTGNVNVPVIVKSNVQSIKLNVEYQGCSFDGVCYPPVHKNVTIKLPANATASVAPTSVEPAIVAPTNNTMYAKIHALLTNQNAIQTLLQEQPIYVLWLVFAGLGLFLAFTPCILPMIPILTSIIVGQKQTASTQKALVLSLIYVTGSALTYAIAGVAAASMGHSLQVWFEKPWIIAATSGLFVLLSLSLFGYYELRLPNAVQNRLNNFSNKQQGGSYAGVFLMGVMSALIVSPCVTAPLVGVLMYIAQTGDRVLGGSALFAMGIGMGFPLILAGMSAGKWLPKRGAWMEAVKNIFGILMLAMAVWMLSRAVSPTITTMLWSLLLIGVAIFFSVQLPKLIGRRVLNRAIGGVVGCSAVMLMLTGIGSPNLMDQLLHKQHIKSAATTFVLIHNIADLNKQLADAQASRHPVILDFYADWCESCVSMDKHVFGTPDVLSKLNNYILLRADLTQNDETLEALLKEYGVIAPPTVLFFDKQGHEMNSHRIVGEVDAQEFMTRIESIKASVALK